MRIRPLSILLTALVITSNVIASSSVAVANSAQIVAGPGRWFDYVVVIMMENHSINNTYDNGAHSCFGNCTYYTSLANSNGLAENYTNTGVLAGSVGDYVAITSGYGNSSANCIGGPFSSGCQLLQIPSIVDRLESASLTWKAYMEDYPIPSGCYNSFSGHYSPTHNPFIYYANIQNNVTRCSLIVNANSQLVSQSSCWPTALPNDDLMINDLNSASTVSHYMFLTPNSVDDNHECDNVSVGNAWLNKMIPQILGSTVFKTKRAALFITFDEPGCTGLQGGCPSSGPQLYTVWASNSAKPTTKVGFKSVRTYTHYSPLKTIENNWSLPPLIASTDGSTQTNNMQEFFG